jgi:hypothetical protein
VCEQGFFFSHDRHKIILVKAVDADGSCSKYQRLVQRKMKKYTKSKYSAKRNITLNAACP